jgi:hypothetical protein
LYKEETIFQEDENMASRKSHVAFKFNVERLFERSQSGVYFWTATFRAVLTVKQASRKWSALSKDLIRELGVSGIRVYELHDEHGLHIHWLVDRFLPVQVVRRIAERHGFGRIHVKRCGKWVCGYLAKYLSKEVRAACLKGKRLWAGFGNATWCRVKDINVRSWLGDEYRRLRGESGTITRGQSYELLQDALRSYALWVDGAQGLEVWVPPKAAQ